MDSNHHLYPRWISQPGTSIRDQYQDSCQQNLGLSNPYAVGFNSERGYQPDFSENTNFQFNGANLAAVQNVLDYPQIGAGLDYTSLPQVAPTNPNNQVVTVPLASKSPSLANILQFQEPAHTSRVTKPQTRGSARRQKNRNQSRATGKDWKKYKDYIIQLYMGKEKTVPEISDEMSKKFSFVASEQMYKNKFVEWGISKYIPRNLPATVTQWVAMKVGAREQEGKATEVKYGNRVLPLDRIRENAKRLKPSPEVLTVDTPKDITYRTPAKIDITFPSPFHPSVISPHTPEDLRNRWTLSAGSLQPKEQHHLRLNWNGYNRSELDAMRDDAKALSELERFEEAEHKLREVLAGFEYLLSPTNEDTMEVGYELAEFYAHHSHMHEADAVLEWMSDNCLKTWGIHHKISISHMVRVTDLYHKWSRTNDAITVLLRAADMVNNPPCQDENRTSHIDNGQPSVPSFDSGSNKTSQEERPTSLSRVIEISDINGKKDSLSVMEFQLRLANIQVRAKDADAEELIKSLIEQCEKFPEKFEAHIFKARGSLIELYHELERTQELETTLESTKKSFFAIMKKDRGPKSLTTLNAAVDLSGLYVKICRYKDADAMFYEVERKIEVSFGEEQVDDQIDLLTNIGMLYQNHKRWNDAKARFEHALAISLAVRGRECMVSKRLQAGLDNRRFSMAALLELQHTHSLRRRLKES